MSLSVDASGDTALGRVLDGYEDAKCFGGTERRRDEMMFLLDGESIVRVGLDRGHARPCRRARRGEETRRSWYAAESRPSMAEMYGPETESSEKCLDARSSRLQDEADGSDALVNAKVRDGK